MYLSPTSLSLNVRRCLIAVVIHLGLTIGVYAQCNLAVSPSGSSICSATSTTFTASGGSNYRWYKDAPLNPGNQVGSGASFTPLTAGSYYLAGDDNCGPNRVLHFVYGTIPGTGIVSPVTIPFNGSAVLKPTTVLADGESFRFYASDQTTLLSSGKEFYTGTLTANTTFYVSRWNSYCESAKTSFIVSINALPVANAGADISVTLPISTQNIVGSGTDTGGSVTYEWKKISGPTITMGGTTSNTLSLTSITAGIYVFRLVVTDNIGQITMDEVVFEAKPSTPNNNYNYTRQEDILMAGITNASQVPALTAGQKASATSYLDELGRSLETVEWQATPGKYDVITPIVYDNLGRNAKSYLPAVTSAMGDGLFKTVLNASGEYSGTAIQSTYTDKPYAVTLFDNSPLGRSIEQGSFGLAWQPGSSTGTAKQTYAANTASDVRLWTINTATVSTGLPQSSSTWSANQLSLITSTNYVSASKQLTKQTLSDVQGLKLVERVKVDASNWAETIYVYDLRNDLRFVITPQLYKVLKAAANYNVTLDQVNRYCFQYLYDERHRVIASKVPGVEWVHTVYDQRDRVVLSQDGNQRTRNEWTYFEYDENDRRTVIGIFRPSTNYSRDHIQGIYNGSVTLPPTTSTVLTAPDIVSTSRGNYLEFIASNSITLQPGFVATASSTVTFRVYIYPTQPAQLMASGTREPLEYFYYDSYSGDALFQDTNLAFYSSEPWESVAGTTPMPFVKFDRVRGQMTGKKIKVLGTNQWESTVFYYDERQRAIQVNSSLYVGGFSRVSKLYDFSGKGLQTRTTEAGQVTARRFEYDHAGRMSRVFHKLNNQPQVILLANEYNELGQLKDKKLYSTDVTATTPTYFQSVDLTYDIHGWLNKANSASVSDPGEVDYFGFELGYDADVFGASISTGLRKDGNITAAKWRNDFSSRQNLYVYDYDNLNRISSAEFKSGSNSLWNQRNDFYSEKAFQYDYNGNLSTLQRNKQSGALAYQTIDNLSYSYGSSGGNQLMKVDELSGSALKDQGFKDGNTSGDDYLYDSNGNLITDKNKAISSIDYNFLDLPERVTFSDGKYMQYVYNAEGGKLRQTYFSSTGQQLVKTDYVGDQLLINDVLAVIFHEEGRLLPPDNANLILNRDANSLDGFSGNGTVQLSSVYQNSQTYVKVATNQTTANPGVLMGNYSVKPGQRYQFKVLGYRETTHNAFLYVKSPTGDILWTGALLPQGVGNETWSTSEFTVPAAVTQVTVGVLWQTPGSSGATLYINQVALYKMDWEYQFFLTDHVGSTRVVLSTNPATLKYTATFETENQSVENGANAFFNVKAPYLTTHPSNVTPGGNEVIRLDNTYRVGPTRSIKVYPGDLVDASVSSFYASMSGLTPAATNVIAAALSAALVGNNIPGFDQGVTAAYNNSDGAVTGFTLSPNNGSTRPSAFLNYILFNENYEPLEAKSVPVGATAGVNQLISFSGSFGTVNVKQVGIMFIYLSYDNDNSNPVYFDDLKITHTESPMIQVNDNYPFGLTAYSWIREGEYENRFLYQGKESDDVTGWQDFHARQYDVILGRFSSNDPANQFASGFIGMGNNPVAYIDPDGQFAILPMVAWAAISVAANGVVNEIRDRPFFDNWGQAAVSGALSGGYWAAIIAGLNLHMPSYSVDLGNGFSFGISPAIAFGSNGFSIGANMGLSYSSKNFSAGINFGVGYTNMQLDANAVKGFSTRIGGGFTAGNEKWNGGLHTTAFSGAGVSQRVAGARLTLGGVRFTYENDGAPFETFSGRLLNDQGDRFRTNAASVGYGDFDLRLNMFTGDSYGHEDKSQEVIAQGYPLGLKTGDADMYRLGALSIGYRGNQVGWNSEGIRDVFQNWLAHTIIMPQPYFRRLPSGYPGTPYTSTTQFQNPYSLWTF